MPSIRELHTLARPSSWLDGLAQRTLWRLRNGKLLLGRWYRLVALRLNRRHPPEPLRLHVGCGCHRLEGWLNIDIDPNPGVDRAMDVTRGLPFGDVHVIFAEHFLEHLAVDEALLFLLEAHRVLRPGGTLRLTTPNLEWVLATNYRRAGDADGIQSALAVNRAFYAWGHRFLWDEEMLGRALRCCGFEEVRWLAPGDSGHPEMKALEGHEQYDDSPELRHVLVAEAARGRPQTRRLAELVSEVQRGFLHHVTRSDAEAYWREDWWRWWKGRRAGSV